MGCEGTWHRTWHLESHQASLAYEVHTTCQGLCQDGGEGRHLIP